jgi:hypothetical protein
VFVIWILAGVFTDELTQLEGDEKLLKMEMESGIYLQRPAVRRSLANLILIIGGAQTVLMAFIYLEQYLSGNRFPAVPGGVWNILAYFALALVLLSLTQFSILRVRWSLERIPISPDMAGRWIAYSVGLLLVIALISSLLPTRYSVGLLEVLGYLIAVLFGILNLIFTILALPIMFLFSLIAYLLGKTESLSQPGITPVMPTVPPPGATGTWSELLKSILFWLVFLGVIGLSIFHYIKQNQELRQQLGRLPLLRQLFGALKWLFAWIHGVNQEIAAAVDARLRRFRARQAAKGPGQAWGFVNLRRLSPRQRVIFFFLALVRRGGEKGLERMPSQTPYEYSQALIDQLPAVEKDVSSLAEQFVEARYSQHEITPTHANLVQRYWEHIKRALRKK